MTIFETSDIDLAYQKMRNYEAVTFIPPEEPVHEIVMVIRQRDSVEDLGEVTIKAKERLAETVSNYIDQINHKLDKDGKNFILVFPIG